MTGWNVVDIHCGPCHRMGDKNPPRLARFARAAGGGPIHVQPFTVDGQKVIPAVRERPDGGRTWRLMSECGHDKRIREERIVVLFGLIGAGESSLRVTTEGDRL
jgi:hypothetical protein